MSELFQHVVAPGVAITGASLAHPRAGKCVAVRLEGVAQQAPVVIVLREPDLEACVADALRLLSTVAAQAGAQPLEVGDVTTLRNRKAFGAFSGVAYARSALVPEALVAVPLLDEELAVAELAGAPRVLAHLASALRAWPVVEEVVRDRPACITPRALVQSALTQGMPRAGACAASTFDGRALLTLGKRASAALLDTLRGGRPFVCGAPLDDTSADAVLVSRDPTRPAVAFSLGAVDASTRVAANIVAVSVGGEAHRGAGVVEDALALALSPADARRLCGAFETGTPFFLDDPAPGRLKCTLRPAEGAVQSARARVEQVFLVAVELMSEPDALAQQDLTAIARFHDAVVVAVDQAVAAHRPASGTELRLRWRAEPARAAPRVSVQKTDATPQALVEAIGDAVMKEKAPDVPAPIAFELVFAVL